MIAEEEKIMDIHALAAVLDKLRQQGKQVVLCHGCFDLLHPGHVKYLQAAKRMGDVLVATLSPDRYIDKGPDRPAFTESLRAEQLAALQCVDYVAVNKWPTAEETIRLLKPTFYVKGQEFKHLEDKTGKIQREHQVAQEVGTQLRFTEEIVFSSTALMKKYFMLGS